MYKIESNESLTLFDNLDKVLDVNRW